MLLFATSLSLAHAGPADEPKKNNLIRIIASLFAPPDEDGDGINDRKDRCRVTAETVNGYADDDGCPDHLSVLDVAVWADGRLVSTELAVARADGTISGIEGPRAANDLVPGEVVHVTAVHGCTVTTGVIEIVPGHNRIDLELTPNPALVQLTSGECVTVPDGVVADADQ